MRISLPLKYNLSPDYPIGFILLQDLAEARQKMARLQVEAAPPRSPHCRPISLGDLDSVSVVSRAESQDLDKTYGTFGKETAVGTFSTIEKDLDNRELMTQVCRAWNARKCACQSAFKNLPELRLPPRISKDRFV